MTLDDVRKLLLRRSRTHIKYRGTTGVKAWCEAHGVAATHVSEFLNGKRGPTSDLLENLGLEWRIVRKRAPVSR
jgi:hypothetical protein